MSALAATPRALLWTRVALAGPAVLIVAFVIMLGMAVWLPKGAGGIDNIAVPVILFPLIWAALFFYACLDRKLARVGIVLAALAAANGAAIGWSFAQASPESAVENGETGA